MTSDATRVLYLLRTLTLWLPSSPVCIRREQTGEAPSLKVVCQACQGAGVAGKRTKRRCARCAGTGRLTVDSYTQREVSTTEREVVRQPERKACDACSGDGYHRNGRQCRWCEGLGTRYRDESQLDAQIERVEGMAKIRAGIEAPERFQRLQDAKKWLYRQGSYRELEDALTLLRVSHPSLERTLRRFVIEEQPVHVSGELQSLIDEGCERLARVMPHPIRVPPWAKTQPHVNGKGRWANGNGKSGRPGWAQAQRNEEIRRLRSEGMSLVKIGRHVGLSKQRVSEILNDAA